MTGALTRYIRSFTGFGRNARIFLLTTIVFGAGISLYWVDFNLYLEATGIDKPSIGWLMSVSQLAGFLVALPASALSNRIGRRKVMLGGVALIVAALLAILPGNPALITIGVLALGAGQAAFGVVQIPYMAEHTRPDQRNEFFSIWQALQFLTGLVAVPMGGLIAASLSGALNLSGDVAQYRIVLSLVAVMATLGFASLFLLSGDRPPADHTAHAHSARFGIVISDPSLFFRLLLPGFITALGAGQLIPFLNLFIKGKFGLDLAEVNIIFGITSLGTAAAMLAQPAVARRYGRIGSIVLVQGASIPFLVVLGFSPVLWTVIAAMAVRNSLMNAGSPIFDAFAMDRVSIAERATLSAGMSMLWSLGWTVAPLYYGWLQATLGFTAGYAVDFVTIIVLYSLATSLLWFWFRGTDAVPAGNAETLPIAVEPPVVFEQA
jgi:MFS family permease